MLDFLGENLKSLVDFDLLSLNELRLRVGGKMIAFYMDGSEKVIDRVLSREDMDGLITRLTKHSVYAYAESIRRGFITADDGERVGICGNCVVENGCVKMIKEITSLCVRVPREVVGFSAPLEECFLRDGLSDTIVISPPGFGKTTFLRDTARMISVKLKKNVLIVDEKAEISGAGFSFGQRCDKMLYCDKSFGFSEGVRNLRPDVIVCDELSSAKDCAAVMNAALAGVTVIASAHSKDLETLKRKPIFNALFDNNIFKTAVVIGVNRSVSVNKI